MDVDQVFLPDPDGTDAPRAGHFSLERRGKVPLPVRIWFGQPVDPDGNLLERSPRWQMQVGDRLVDPSAEEWEQVWPQCAKSPITPAEYRYRLERINYAKTGGAPSDPWAKRSGKIDLLTAPIPE